MAWTTPATVVAGDVIQSSWANTHVRDNERYLKGLDGGVAIQDTITVTGSVNPSVGINAGGTSGAVTGEVKALAFRATSNVSFVGGAGIELGFDGTNAFVQGYNRTGAAYVPVVINASLVKFVIDAVEKGRVNSTGFSGDGSQLTALNASEITSGVLNAGRLPGTVVLTSSSIDATKLTGPVLSATQTIANNGTYTVCAATAGGWFALRDDQGNTALLYLYSGPLQSELSDPFSVFTFVSGTASSWNLYISGGNIIIENKRGSSRTIQIVRLAGG